MACIQNISKCFFYLLYIFIALALNTFAHICTFTRWKRWFLEALASLSIIHIWAPHLNHTVFLCFCVLLIRKCCKISVENPFLMGRKTTGLMNSCAGLGHWRRVLTCLYKTDRQQTSDIQQQLTWQTGNQQSRYIPIYFVWINFIWFDVWSACPCKVIYCNVAQWEATKCYKRPHVCRLLLIRNASLIT